MSPILQEPPLSALPPSPRSPSWIQFKNPKEAEESQPFLELPAYQCGDDDTESIGVIHRVALFACEVKMPNTKSGYLSTSYKPSLSRPTTDDSEVLTELTYWFHDYEETAEQPQKTSVIQNTSLHPSAKQSLTGWPQPKDMNTRNTSLEEDPFAPGIPYKIFVSWAGTKPSQLCEHSSKNRSPPQPEEPGPVEAPDYSELEPLHTPPHQKTGNDYEEKSSSSYPSPGTGFQDGIQLSPALARLMLESHLVIVPLSLGQGGIEWYSYILGPVYTQFDIEDYHLVAGQNLHDNMANVFQDHFKGTVKQLGSHDADSDIISDEVQGRGQNTHLSGLSDSHGSEDETREPLLKRQKLEGLQGSNSSSQSDSEPKTGSSEGEDGGGHDETAITLDQSPERPVQGDTKEEYSDDAGAKRD